MTHDTSYRTRISRRQFLSSTAAGTALAVAGGTFPKRALAAASGLSSVCDDARDINIINGRFLTMDRNNTIASAIAIRGGRIAQVGSSGALGPCGQTINLRGATVIPGLHDSHVHYIRDCLNPGHGVRIIETAQSIPELQQMIAAQIKQLAVPVGEFITCIGGWNVNALAEVRLPTIAELDAAAPNHPVYLSTTGTGGGVTNSAGRAFFQEKGVAVAANGTLNTNQAFTALRLAEIAGDSRVSTRSKGTREVNAFALSLGMTTVQDVGGGNPFAGLPSLFVDFKPYQQAMDLWRAGNLYPRHRIWLWNDFDNTTSDLRVANGLSRIGDDFFRIVGIGERTNAGSTDPAIIPTYENAARNGWPTHQHSSTVAEINHHLDAFQAGNAIRPIKDLRWQLTHVNSITESQLDRLIGFGTGVTVAATAFTSGTATTGSSGTPYRLILDKMHGAGIPVGASCDGTNAGAFNPWLMMYFMTTGKNNAGNKINPLRNGVPQECTRLEALWMYTYGSAYYSFDESRLGSIEAGKYADLAVLSDDPLTVPDEKFKRLHAVLTMVDGRVVHGSLG